MCLDKLIVQTKLVWVSSGLGTKPSTDQKLLCGGFCPSVKARLLAVLDLHHVSHCVIAQ